MEMTFQLWCMGTRQEKCAIMEGVCDASVYKLLASVTRPISSTEHIVT